MRTHSRRSRRVADERRMWVGHMPDVVLVTGGSRGIGAAVAAMAAARGAAVGVNYARDGEAAARVVERIAGKGGRAIAVQADVADEHAVEAMFARVEDELGRPSGLVNSAGIAGGRGPLVELSVETLRRTVEVNLIGTMLCSRTAAARMSTGAGGKGGAIVNISSAAAVMGAPGERVHYAAAKGGIDSFTLGLGRELGREGIRVNAVRPGLIDTEMNRAPEDPDRLARLGPSVPMGRVGTAEEVAEAVLWLLSDAAAYVTGTVVTVAGGRC